MSADYVADRSYRRLPIVTGVIFLLNLIGLIYEYAVGQDAAIYRFAMYQGALQDGQWVRLFVSAFLHFGILHFEYGLLAILACHSEVIFVIRT